MVLLAIALGACGSSFKVPEGEAYGYAVESLLEDKNRHAARAAALYMSGVSRDDDRYDRAQMILGQALERLGLTHAAVLRYLDVATSRRKADLLDNAVEGIQRIVDGGPHDQLTLVEGFIASADISDLRPELQDFVDYHQGLDSLRRGLLSWSRKRFAGISPGSRYAARARYVQAVFHLGAGEDDRAREELEAIAGSDKIAEAVRQDAEIALARLAMEQARYQDAARHYETIKERVAELPELLLEMAWAQFYLGDSRRALGYLLALDAPVYEHLIAPERYMLEAVCLRRLCQFDPARLAATRLREKYGTAISDLIGGIAPYDSRSVVEAARRRHRARDAALFLHRLQRELEQTEDLEDALGPALYEELVATYQDALVKAKREETLVLRHEASLLAQELLRAEDGVRLILHELSVGLLRGGNKSKGADRVREIPIPAGGEDVIYRFQREFWTDELDDLLVVVKNRCFEREPQSLR